MCLLGLRRSRVMYDWEVDGLYQLYEPHHTMSRLSKIWYLYDTFTTTSMTNRSRNELSTDDVRAIYKGRWKMCRLNPSMSRDTLFTSILMRIEHSIIDE